MKLKRFLLSGLALVLTAALTTSSVDWSELITEEVYVKTAAAQGVYVASRTQDEIRAYVNSHPFDAADTTDNVYSSSPSFSAPFDTAGVLNDNTLNNALNALNTYRYIAGLGEVTLDTSNANNYQSLAYLLYANAANNNFKNGSELDPETKPSNMSSSVYNAAETAKSNGFLAAAGFSYQNLASTVASTTGYINESSYLNGDPYLNYRRKCLNPSLGKVAFGQVSQGDHRFYSMYADDKSVTSGVTGVCWPAQNTPRTMIYPNTPWSYSYGHTIDQDKVKVTLTRKSDGHVWNFSKSSADGKFSVSNTNVGVYGSILFLPNGLTYDSNDSYEVVIDGLSVPVKYEVNIFNLNSDDDKIGDMGDVTVTGTTSSSISLAWDEVVGADSYHITVITKTGISVLDKYVTGTSYTITGLTENTDYIIYMSAARKKSDGTYKSGNLKIVNAKTLANSEATVDPVKNLTISKITANSAVVSWDADAADSHIIEKYTNGSWEKITELSSLYTQYQLTGLSKDTTYKIRVKAVRGQKESEPVEKTFTTLPDPPSMPSDLTVTTVTANSVSLKWTASPEADSYSIEYKLSSSGTVYTQAGETKSTSFTVTGLKAKTNYQFRVYALKKTAKSSPASIIKSTLSSEPVQTVGSVENFSAKPSTNSVVLTWDAAENATKYVIYYGKNSDDPDKSVEVGAVTTCTVTGLDSGTSYTFCIYAYNGTAVSPEKKLTTKTSDASVNPVTNLTASPSATSVSLSWTKSSNAKNYKVEMKEAGGSWTTLSSTVTSNSYNKTGLKENTSYSFRVTAQNGTKYSTTVSVTTKTLISKVNPVTGLKAVAGENSITLSWKASSNAESYKVEMKKNGSWSVLSSGTTETSYTVYKLTANTTYDFRVTAQNGTLYSSAENISATTISVTVDPVTNLKAVPTANSVTVSWTKSANATSYKVEMREGSGSWTTLSSSVTSNSYNKTGLKENTSYSFRVTAQKGSVSSSALTVTTKTLVSKVDPVTNLKAVPTVNSVALSWTKSSNAESYKVEMKEDGGSWTTLNEAVASNAYNKTGLKENTAYTFRVTAQNGSVSSTPATVSTTTLAEAVNPVTNLNAAASENSVSLSWTASSNATSYKVEMKEGDGDWNVLSSTVTTTSYEATGLKENTSYAFKVTAQKGTITSSAETVTVKTSTVPIDSVTGLSATATSNSVTLSWNAVENAAKYRIEWYTSSGWASLATIKDTTYTKSNLSENTGYRFRVFAVKSNNTESAPSEVTAATTTEPVNAVGGLTAVPTYNSVTLTWNAVSNATGYKIEWLVNNSWKELETVTSTSYTKTGLSENTSYTFRVTAVKGNTQSEPADVSAKTSIEQINAVSGLSATTTSNSVSLKWNKVSSATGYRVEWLVNNTWTALDTVTAVSYTKTGLSEDKSYKFRVIAVKANAESAPSEISAKTQIDAVGEISGLSATATYNSVKLSWKMVSNAAQYIVEMKNGSSWTQLGAVLNNTFTKDGLLENTEYTFRVSAKKSNSQSEWAEVTAKTGVEPINAVSGLSASATTNSVTLNWNKVNNATGYRVEWLANNKWTTLDTVTATSYTKNGLSENTTYQFRVIAVKANAESSAAAATATTSIEPINAVTGLTAQTTTSSATLKWNAVSNATGYKVEWYANNAWKLLDTVTATSYTKTGLSENTSYKFRVTAIKANAVSAPAEITAKTAVEPVASVSGLNASVSGNSIKLTWNAVSNATGYKVQMLDGSTWKDIGSPTATSFTKSGLNYGTTYKFRVFAVKGDIESGYVEASATTEKETIAKVGGLKATPDVNSITLSWNKVTGAASYKVEMLVNGAWKQIYAGTAAKHTESGLAAGTTYNFRVYAVKNSVVSEPAEISAATNAESVNAVTGLTASSDETSITLTWNAVSGAESYKIEMKQNGVWSAAGNVTAASFTKSGLKPGTSYEFRVYAVKNNTDSDPAVISTTTKAETVGAVTGLNSSATVNSITVLWNKVDGATGYKLEMLQNGNWTEIYNGTNTTFTKNGLEADTSYEFRVCAVKNSAVSDYAKITAVTDKDTVNAVSGLASSATVNSVTLSWNKVTGATGYKAEMLVNGQWTQVYSGTATTFTKDGLSAETSYEFRVYAVKNKAVSEAAKITAATDKETVNAVSGLNTQAGVNSVKLTWNAVEGATGYKAEMLVNGVWKQIYAGTATECTKSGLLADTSYEFRVCAVKNNAVSDYANITAVTNKETVNAVTGLTTFVGTNSIKLSWNTVSGADGYIVEMLVNGEWKQVYSDTYPSFTQNGLKPDTSYEFRVYAAKNGVRSDYTKIAAVTTKETVDAVSGLNAQSGVNQIKLTWNAVEGATGYKAEMLSNGEWTEVYEGTACSFTKNDLKPESSYEFRVCALKNNASSEYANITAATNKETVGEISGLTSTADENSVTLSWNAVKDAEGYRAEMLKNGEWVKVYEGQDTACTVTSLEPAASYEFRVCAFKNTAVSDYANITAITNAEIINKVTGLKAVADVNSVTLSWNAVEGASGYRVYMLKNGEWIRLNDAEKTTYKIGSLAAATSYDFRVYTVKGGSTSEPANITAVTDFEDIDGVRGLSAKCTTTQIKLAWNTVSGATGYKIEMCQNDKWSDLGSVSTNSFLKKELTPNTAYMFKIYAMKNSSLSFPEKITVVTNDDGGVTAFGVKTSVKATSIAISWAKAADASAYRLTVCENGFWHIAAQTTNTSYTAANLKPSTKYTFRLYRMSGKTLGEYAEFTLTTKAAPKLTAITGLKASPTANTVKLTWTKNSTAEKYRVEVYKNGKWVKYAEGKNTYCTVKNLNSGTAYKFRVCAMADVYKGAYANVSAVTKPANVTSLKYTASASAIKLTWKKSAGADSYQIERLNGKKWVKAATVKGTSYTAKKLKASTAYKFRVCAVKSKVKGAYSNITVTTKPANVTSLKYTASASAIKLTWKKSAGASGYQIERLNGKKWVKAATVKGTSYTAKKLKASTSYKFRVCAVKGKVKGAYTNITATTKPANVTSLKYTASASAIKLTWKKSAGASGYQIERLNGKKWVKAATVKGTSYTAKKLKASTSYKFRVCAVKGKVKGAYTNITATTKPANVTSLKYTASASAIKLTWKKSAGASGYQIERLNGKKWVKVATVKGTSYTIKKLKAGTAYKFRVCAVKGKIKGAYTNISVTVKPANISNLKASSSKTSVKLSWKKSAGANGYQIERFNGKKWVKVSTVKGTSCTVKKLKTKTNYKFRVCALKGKVKGAYKNISVKTK